MAKSGGAIANRSGSRLEKFVSGVLEDRDYQYVKSHRFVPMQKMNQPIYTYQYKIGKDIYGRSRKVDIILYHPRLWKNCLVIECKWQSSSGSVDAKYPFEVLSIEYNKYDTILILDGGGYSKGAQQWILKQAGKSNKLKHVFNQGEFSKFASRGKLG